jgi:membrane protease YdiL (CAAX protease family)
MKPGAGRRQGFLLTVVIGWIVLTAAGVYYARLKSVPPAIAAPLIAAFLVEFVFYALPGFVGLREWLSDHVPPRTLASGLALSAFAPYLIYSLATGQFRAVAFARLGALVLVVSFWYLLRQPAPSSDLALLGLVAAALVVRFSRQVYISPAPGVTIDILGNLMLIRLYAGVMLILREVEETGFGFLPTAQEWKIGFRNYLWFLPIGIALAAGFRLARLKTSWTEVAAAPLLFLGFLWVVALSEEFLARGLLQRWLTDWTGRPALAHVLASTAFGFCHLWFSPGFPNWKMAIAAAIAGWFYGRSYNEGGGIRAAMVTHALTVTTWRTLS